MCHRNDDLHPVISRYTFAYVPCFAVERTGVAWPSKDGALLLPRDPEEHDDDDVSASDNWQDGSCFALLVLIRFLSAQTLQRKLIRSCTLLFTIALRIMAMIWKKVTKRRGDTSVAGT